MDEQTVRDHAQAFSEALVAGNVDRAIEDFSAELRRNLGEVLALLPLPASEAAVESVELSGSGYNVVIRFVGEASEDLIQTRWKDRDGRPTIVEAGHLSRIARIGETGEAGAPGAAGGSVEDQAPSS